MTYHWHWLYTLAALYVFAASEALADCNAPSRHVEYIPVGVQS